MRSWLISLLYGINKDQMSATLHVNHQLTITLACIGAAGPMPWPSGYSFGWMFSADGGNISMDASGPTATIKCIGTTVKGDYVAGQPVKIVATVTSQSDEITSFTGFVNLVPAETIDPATPLSGPTISGQLTFGVETPSA